jgi:hypothetical protein
MYAHHPFLSLTRIFPKLHIFSGVEEYAHSQIKLNKPYLFPEKSHQAQLAIIREHTFLPLTVYPYTTYALFEPEYIRKKTVKNAQENKLPAHRFFPFAKIEDVEKATTSTLLYAGFRQQALCFSTLQEAEGLQPTFSLGGPFTLASTLIPFEELLSALISTPEKCQRLFMLATEAILALITEQTKALATPPLLLLEECTATQDVLSPELFSRFVAPTIMRIYQECWLKKIPLCIYAGGLQNDLLHAWSNCVPNNSCAFLFENQTDLQKAIQIVGGKGPILGGLPKTLPTQKEEIFQLVKKTGEILKKAPHGGLFSAGRLSEENTSETLRDLTESINQFRENN